MVCLVRGCHIAHTARRHWSTLTPGWPAPADHLKAILSALDTVALGNNRAMLWTCVIMVAVGAIVVLTARWIKR
jgi:hypothetical protein